jgi:hypothetical protein
VDELKALLRDRKTRSVKRRVDAGGKEILGTRGLVDIGFWPDYVSNLSVVPDADAVGDRLGVDYTNYVDAYSLPDERTEFFVRRLDVERWEGLYFPAIAAPPSPPEKYKRYATDDALVTEGVNGIDSGAWANPSKAAEALADRAKGTSHKSTVDRLRKKIGKKIGVTLDDLDD